MPWDGIGECEVAAAEASSGKFERFYVIALSTGFNTEYTFARVEIDDPFITGAGRSLV